MTNQGQSRTGVLPTILLVEEDQIVAEDIRRGLERHGYRIAAIVSTGREAIARAEESRPDLVVVDIVLHNGEDSFTAVQEIRARVDVPVIYLSSYADRETVERAKQTGPLGFVVKPFDERELCFTVEMALHRYHEEIAARETGTLFRELADNSDHVAWMMDAELTSTLYVNKAFEQIWGRSLPPPESGLQPWLAAVHPDDGIRVLSMYTRARQGEFDPGGLEYRIVRPDGSSRWIWTRCFAIRNSAGVRYRIGGTSADITRQQWAWQMLQESEERYRLMVEHSRDLISRHSSDGMFLYASPAAYALLDYKPEDLVGHPITEYLHPDDRARIETKYHTFAASLALGPFTYRIRKRDGTYTWFETVGRTILDPATDEIREIIAVSRTIDRRKDAEEFLRRYGFIVNTAREFMTLINRDYIYEAANDAYCMAHGKVRGEIVGQTVASVWGDETFNTVIKKYLDQAFAGEEVHYESWFTFEKLGRRCFDVKYYPYTDMKGEITHCVVVSFDTTAYKTSEEQTRRSLDEKELLLKEVHHRVKNNLQIISSLLNLQLNVITNKETREMVRESQNRVRSMALIHEKLYQSGNLGRISLEEYLRSLTRELFRSYGASGVNLRMEVEEIRLDVDTAIPCGLMVNELVSNALKYAFPDGKEGEILVKCAQVSRDRVALTVADNGAGLPEDVERKAGESLGFQLVHLLVKQLRGTLDIVRGGGTTFQVTFPLR
jgi:PAS domain S-box-containing protein